MNQYLLFIYLILLVLLTDAAYRKSNDVEIIAKFESISNNRAELERLNRKEFNQVLKEYLIQGKTREAEKVVNTMTDLEIVGADTVNILLKDAFYAEDDGEKALRIYHRYFNSTDKISPTVITLNTMMDGYRGKNNIDSIRHYFLLFRTLGLEPDYFTFSTLVRVAHSKEMILDILDQVKSYECNSVSLS